jgi:hypothetical protein
MEKVRAGKGQENPPGLSDIYPEAPLVLDLSAEVEVDLRDEQPVSGPAESLQGIYFIYCKLKPSQALFVEIRVLIIC